MSRPKRKDRHEEFWPPYNLLLCVATRRAICAIFMDEGVGVRRGKLPEREDDSYRLASSSMLQAFGLTDIGCVRRNNEDFYALAPDANLYIVADGIGGAQAGEVAAQMAVEALVEHVRRDPVRNASTLSNAFEQAHRQVLAAASSDARLRGMGCTLVAALVEESVIFLANVGDSRAYVFVGRVCEYISSDQTWLNEVGRKLGISAAELKSHPYRHVLTVAVGSDGAFRVNSCTLPLAGEMRVLLCTDGLHDVVSDLDIADIMLMNETADWTCRRLVEAAKCAGGPDNITVLVLEYATR
jgi:PPM family protein phosphatase